jgi:hypothetical protein
MIKEEWQQTYLFVVALDSLYFARKVQPYSVQTLDQGQPYDPRLLHRTPVANMINWTKQHLDAYLATAEMACEWNVEPG